MLIGMGTPIMTLPLSASALREVDLVGVFRYANTYKEGIELLSKANTTPDAPDFRKLVTHRVQGLENADQAFKVAGNTRDGEGKLVLKVVIEADS